MPRAGNIPRVKAGDELTADLLNRIIDAVNSAGFSVAAPLSSVKVAGTTVVGDDRPPVVFARITGASGSPPAHTWRGVYDIDGMLQDWPSSASDNGVDFIYEASGGTLPTGTVVIARRLAGSMKLWTQSEQCP